MATYTKTVVFTDLANYTQSTSKVNRDELRKLIADHEAHTQKLFAPHGGKLVKNLGDSFMALFDSASDAMKACMDLVTSNIQMSGNALRFRASAATGDVEEINGDYFGEAVNLSARINSKTPAGEAWFANRTRMCMNQAEIPWESVGSFDFKGIPEAVECFRAVPAGNCFLPDSVKTAVKHGKFVLITKADPVFDPNEIKKNRYVILNGFEIGSSELQKLVSSLPPTTPPGQIWLQVENIPTSDRKKWQDMGRGLLVGTEASVLKVISESQKAAPAASGSQTVFMDLSGGGDVSLDLIGLALPMVPMAHVIHGYAFDLHPDGSWGFNVDGALLRIEVNMSGIYINTFNNDVYLNGRKLSPSSKEPIRNGAMIRTPFGQIRFRGLGGKYKGLLIGPPTYSMEIRAGERVELGREPNFPGFTLPDRGGLDSIQWAPGGRAAKARQAGLTLDRSMTGRHQVMFSAESSVDFNLSPIHERIPTWLFANDKLDRVARTCKVNFGDMIVIGTNVICINKPLI